MNKILTVIEIIFFTIFIPGGLLGIIYPSMFWMTKTLVFALLFYFIILILSVIYHFAILVKR